MYISSGWQEKMEFFLTMKKVANVLTDEIPVVDETAEQADQTKTAKEILLWNDNDYLCKNCILNGLSDDRSTRDTENTPEK